MHDNNVPFQKWWHVKFQQLSYHNNDNILQNICAHSKFINNNMIANLIRHLGNIPLLCTTYQTYIATPHLSRTLKYLLKKVDANLHVGVNERCFTFIMVTDEFICEFEVGLLNMVMGQMMLIEHPHTTPIQYLEPHLQMECTYKFMTIIYRNTYIFPNETTTLIHQSI